MIGIYSNIVILRIAIGEFLTRDFEIPDKTRLSSGVERYKGAREGARGTCILDFVELCNLKMRLSRRTYDGAFHYGVNRGYEGRPIFGTEPDKVFFLALMKKGSGVYQDPYPSLPCNGQLLPFTAPAWLTQICIIELQDVKNRRTVPVYPSKSIYYAWLDSFIKAFW